MAFLGGAFLVNWSFSECVYANGVFSEMIGCRGVTSRSVECCC
jgi:hypothetical protein